MEEVYKVFFKNQSPRVFPEIKEALQFSLDRKIGEWFQLEERTIIRVYGFTHEPYIFPTFPTPRFFSLKFIRHKLIVENEHFISFMKSYEIMFPWVGCPFTIKN